MLKPSALVVSGLFVAATAFAEMQRPQYTVENRFPKTAQLETGVQVDYTEIETNTMAGDLTSTAITPAARVGLIENLTGTLRLPLVNQEPDNGSGEFGPGSLGLGLQLRAYQDILGYPYIIPHAEVQIDTANEDLIGADGDTTTTIGVSIGTVVEDTVTFVGDVSYLNSQDSDSGLQGALSVMWALSDRFSWITEFKVADIDNGGENDTPGAFLGGFSYAWSRKLASSFHVGSGIDSDEDVIAKARAVYTW